MKTMPRINPAALPLLLALAAVPAASAATAQPEVPVERIIDSFIDKETEFAKAREAYTYRQTVKILEYGNNDRVRGRFELVQDIIFGPDRERTERVVYAPVSTLQGWSDAQRHARPARRAALRDDPQKRP